MSIPKSCNRIGFAASTRTPPAPRPPRPGRRRRSGTTSTVPACGALIVCSIFIASSTSSGAPFSTAAPGLARSAITLPGIGASRRRSPSSSCSAPATPSGSTRPARCCGRRGRRGACRPAARPRRRCGARRAAAASRRRRPSRRSRATWQPSSTNCQRRPARRAASTSLHARRAKAEPQQRLAVETPAVEPAPRRCGVGARLALPRAPVLVALELGERGEQTGVVRRLAPAPGTALACSRSIRPVSRSASRTTASRPGGRGTRRCWRRRRCGTAPAPAASARSARWRGRRPRRSAWRSSGRRTA